MFNTDAFALLVFVLGIAAIVVLTARYRWHAFVTIYFITAAVGLAAGLKPEELITYIRTANCPSKSETT